MYKTVFKANLMAKPEPFYLKGHDEPEPLWPGWFDLFEKKTFGIATYYCKKHTELYCNHCAKTCRIGTHVAAHGPPYFCNRCMNVPGDCKCTVHCSNGTVEDGL